MTVSKYNLLRLLTEVKTWHIHISLSLYLLNETPLNLATCTQNWIQLSTGLGIRIKEQIIPLKYAVTD